jgi:hypothetical protein
MKRLTIVFVAAFFLLTAAASSVHVVQTASVSTVTAAGYGVFPEDASFNGIKLSGSTFGAGLEVGGGYGLGHFYTTLAGTSDLGVPLYITLNGQVTGGSGNEDGSVTFSGPASLDLGDGLPTSVPFSVTTTTTGLTLVIGDTTLPAQTLSPASVSIN